MINKSVINRYWKLLVTNIETDEDNEIRENYSECLCKLLETSGYKLLKEIGESNFKKYIMDKVKEYSKDKTKFKARIRFLFMDCLKRKMAILNYFMYNFQKSSYISHFDIIFRIYF